MIAVAAPEQPLTTASPRHFATLARSVRDGRSAWQAQGFDATGADLEVSPTLPTREAASRWAATHGYRVLGGDR